MTPSERWAQPVSGPAYRVSARVFTLAVVLAIVTYGSRVLGRGVPIATPLLVLLAAGAAVVLASSWYIFTGRTTIDAKGVRQDWIFAKSFAWHEIARARHLKLPFTSRLLIVTGRGPVRAIHAGTRELDAAFREVAAWYARPR